MTLTNAMNMDLLGQNNILINMGIVEEDVQISNILMRHVPSIIPTSLPSPQCLQYFIVFSDLPLACTDMLLVVIRVMNWVRCAEDNSCTIYVGNFLVWRINS